MKISKFRQIDSCEEAEHKVNVEEGLRNINNAVKENTGELSTQLSSIVTSSTELLKYNLNINHQQLIANDNSIHASSSELSQEHHNERSELQRLQHESIDEDLETLKQGVSGLQARSSRTKIFNQKIEEDIIIMETSDDLFSLPNECGDIFNATTNLREVNQHFILEEEAKDERCSQRLFNFDTDQKHAIRLDNYSGDSNGFYDAYGHLENNSSDVFIINETLYKLRLRMDENPADLVIEDGFSMGFNDIEHDNALSFKRDHTISGYMVTYVVEGKMNS